MGVYARGFAIYTRVGDRYEDGNGNQHSAQELYAKIASERDYDRFLIQERLREHPERRRLSDSKGVQAFRMNALIDDRGEVRQLFYMLKVICGDNLTDNFETGSTGNLIAVGEPRVSRRAPLPPVARQRLGRRRYAARPQDPGGQRVVGPY
jgi:Sugar-transfer associated ATP-grasp